MATIAATLAVVILAIVTGLYHDSIRDSFPFTSSISSSSSSASRGGNGVDEARLPRHLHVRVKRRTIIPNVGFHFRLNTELEFQSSDTDNRILYLVERLPRDAFVDEDEVRESAKYSNGSIEILHLPHPIDVEKSAEISSPFQFVVRLDTNKAKGFALPVHSRYHAPRDSSAVVYSIPPPVVCESLLHETNLKQKKKLDEEDEVCASFEATWRSVGVAYDDATVRVSVPVGNPAHEQMVLVITLVVVGMGTAIVLLRVK